MSYEKHIILIDEINEKRHLEIYIGVYGQAMHLFTPDEEYRIRKKCMDFIEKNKEKDIEQCPIGENMPSSKYGYWTLEWHIEKPIECCACKEKKYNCSRGYKTYRICDDCYNKYKSPSDEYFSKTIDRAMRMNTPEAKALTAKIDKTLGVK